MVGGISDWGAVIDHRQEERETARMKYEKMVQELGANG
jgi:hypothetical protein